jgi:hypothetical protein
MTHGFGARGFNLGVCGLVTAHSLALKVFTGTRNGQASFAQHFDFYDRSALIDVNTLGCENPFYHARRRGVYHDDAPRVAAILVLARTCG